MTFGLFCNGDIKKSFEFDDDNNDYYDRNVIMSHINVIHMRIYQNNNNGNIHR